LCVVVSHQLANSVVAMWCESIVGMFQHTDEAVSWLLMFIIAVR